MWSPDENQYPRNHASFTVSNGLGVISVFTGAARVHSITLVGGTNTGFLSMFNQADTEDYGSLACRTADSKVSPLSFYAEGGLKVQFSGTGSGRVTVWWN